MNTFFTTKYNFVLASYMVEYMYTKKREKNEDKVIIILRTL